MRVQSRLAVAGALSVLLLVLKGVWSHDAEAAPAPVPDRLEIRILFQNVYGRNQADCEERYRTLARKIRAASPRYDLVAFNEHWKTPIKGVVACDAEVLSRELERGGFVRGVKNHPRAEALWQTGGGLSVFSPHPITEHVSRRFVESLEIPLSGVLYTRVELAPGRQLDLWTTHLESTGADGCDDFCRLGQIADLTDAISIYGLPETGDRRNPALLAGDFNIQGPLSYLQLMGFKRTGNPKFAWSRDREYLDLIHELKGSRDLWLEENPVSPVRGFTYDCQANGLLKCGYRERIDYLFALGDGLFAGTKAPPIRLKRMEVVKWKTPRGLEVSDHYGLDATLEIDWSK